MDYETIARSELAAIGLTITRLRYNIEYFRRESSRKPAYRGAYADKIDALLQRIDKLHDKAKRIKAGTEPLL